MLNGLIKTCQKEVEKVWGKEYWIINQEYCGKLLVLKQGYRSSFHYHKKKKETFLITSGYILLEIEGSDPITMKVGEHITINPYTKHRFTGLSPAPEFIEFASTHSETDSYRDTKSEKIPEEEWKEIYIKYYGPWD